MDEQTTTPSEPVNAGATPAQPDAPVTEAAAIQPTEQQTTSTTEPSSDDNLEWLKNKGIDPSSPEAISRVAEMYRNAEKTMHESTAKASELEKTLTVPEAQVPAYQTGDPMLDLAARVQNMELTNKVNNFFAQNPEAKALEAEMTKLVTERPELREMVTIGALGLQDLHNLAAANPNREKALKTEGGREALQKVADTQLARSVPGAATTSEFAAATQTKASVGAWWDSLGAEGRANPANKAELERVLRS